MQTECVNIATWRFGACLPGCLPACLTCAIIVEYAGGDDFAAADEEILHFLLRVGLGQAGYVEVCALYGLGAWPGKRNLEKKNRMS